MSTRDEARTLNQCKKLERVVVETSSLKNSEFLILNFELILAQSSMLLTQAVLIRKILRLRSE